ncbi:MAG: 16S rRNA (cytosine(1402)-N(4))-methyltransferase RsmH [bacterium]
MENIEHIPVMLKESINLLNIKQGNVYVDGTVGAGGFSEEILKLSAPDGFLIGIDSDDNAVNYVNLKLEKKFDKKRFKIFHSNFSNIDLVINDAGFKKVGGIVVDLGISSIQLESERGFSFKDEGYLDMRIDTNGDITAFDIINYYKEEEISNILWNYGDERFSRKIAKKIIEYRKKKLIETPAELSKLIKNTIGYRQNGRNKIDPATRTFLALRIIVNNEYESLMQFLNKLKNVLNQGAVVCIIAFHSGEDRLVKNFFKNNKDFNIITKKPLTPLYEEIKNNPRSRSAKLRAASLI